MSNRIESYWFPAKRYGWGWGAPTCWQGWAIVGIYIAAGIACGIVFRPRTHPVEYGSCLVVLTIALVVVAWLKGEKTKWKWGEKE